MADIDLFTFLKASCPILSCFLIRESAISEPWPEFGPEAGPESGPGLAEWRGSVSLVLRYNGHMLQSAPTSMW